MLSTINQLRRSDEAVMSHHSQVFVASSDLESRQRAVQILERLGVDAFGASSVSDCRAILAQQNVGLIFCDRKLKDGWYTDVLGAAACIAKTGKVRVILMSSDIDSLEYHAARGGWNF
jgi:DNA-binding NtrC family response regulator